MIALLLSLPLVSGCSSTRSPDETADWPQITIDGDNIDIRVSTKVKPGAYRVADSDGDGVLRVVADNVVLDLTGVTLIGCADGASADTYEGIGVKVTGRHHVVVRGGSLKGFRGGVYLDRCTDCIVQAVEVSDNRAQRLKSTPTVCDDGADWLGPHFNDGNEWWKEYGAGIYLDGCASCTVRGCVGRRTQNGICLRSTHETRVIDNDMSWMSGWGIAMWRSCRNEISHNRADWCVRGYSHGVYDRGQDSAGILMFEQCSDNVIANNSATHGGDGIFMYAGHETTQRTGKGGCDRNLLWRNDFSHAVANAIECTFSDGNRFIENILDDSNYGVWGGYSSNTQIFMNSIRNCRVAGIAIEHGHDNVIEANSIGRCPDGIQLWWDEDKEFLDSVYGKQRNCRSEKYEVKRNAMIGCRRALWLSGTSEARVQGNRILESDIVAHLEGACPDFRLEFNKIGVNGERAVRNDTGQQIRLGANEWIRPGKPTADEGVVHAEPALNLVLDLDGRRLENEPTLHGTQDSFLPSNALRGMKTIVVDEWGPCDPSVARLFPSGITAWDAIEIHLLGPAAEFTVADVEGPVAVHPLKGTAPATLRVSFAPVHGDAEGRIAPFRVTVKSGAATLSATGTLGWAPWSAEFWAWQPAEGEHGGYAAALSDENWKRLVATRPFVSRTVASPRRPWEGAGVPDNHFATRLRAAIRLHAGRWRFRTVSDDGVRVRVDGKKIIDNWTWHAPTPDLAEIELAEGAHEVVVEHFEIDGYETLDLSIEPAK